MRVSVILVFLNALLFSQFANALGWPHFLSRSASSSNAPVLPDLYEASVVELQVCQMLASSVSVRKALTDAPRLVWTLATLPAWT